MKFSISLYFCILLGTCVTFSSTQNLHYNCGNERGVAALTFDDGPHSEHTQTVLDVLKENNVKATFFLLGTGRWEYNETRYIETVKRMIDEGHQIGSHTWSHPDLKTMTDEEITQQLRSHNELIEKHLQKKMRIFRPPYGRFDERIIRIARMDFGYDIIMWNVDTEDWLHKHNTGKSLDWWRKRLDEDNGADGNYIGLHHDPFSGNTNLTQITIDLLKSNGLKFVTVAECIGQPMYF